MTLAIRIGMSTFGLLIPSIAFFRELFPSKAQYGCRLFKLWTAAMIAVVASIPSLKALASEEGTGLKALSARPGACQLVSVINEQNINGRRFTQIGVGWVMGVTTHVPSKTSKLQQTNKIYVVTPAHVAWGGKKRSEGWDYTLVIQCGQQRHSARVRGSSATLDLAVLEVATPPPGGSIELHPLFVYDETKALPTTPFDLQAAGGELRTVLLGRESEPQGYTLGESYAELRNPRSIPLPGTLWPLVLRMNAVRPGFSGSAVLIENHVLGMVTKTETNGARAFALHVRDIWLALGALLKGQDAWRHYTEQDRLLNAALASKSEGMRATFIAPNKPYIRYNLVYDSNKNELVRERGLVVPIPGTQDMVFTEICATAIAHESSDYTSQGSVPPRQTGGDRFERRGGDFGDGGGNVQSSFGHLRVDQTIGYYRSPFVSGCKEGVRLKDGRVLTGIRDANGAKGVERIRGVEDLFQVALANIGSFQTYLAAAGVFAPTSPPSYGHFCESSPVFHLANEFAIRDTFQFNDQTHYVSHYEGSGYKGGRTTRQGGEVTCSPDHNTVQLDLTRIPRSDLQIKANLSIQGAEGEVSLFGGRCRIELTSINTRRLNDWVTEVDDPQIKMRISLGSRGDLLKIQVNDVSKRCLPKERGDSLWLIYYLFREF